MIKPLCVISSPLDTYSGYGARSRDIIKALFNLKGNDWDIKLISQRWGNTPFGFLDPAKPEERSMIDNVIPPNMIGRQPDIWIQITVPNEFQSYGKFSMGITAGIETTACHGSWLEGCNRMNLTLVSSNHAKQVFENTFCEKIDNNTQQKIGDLRLTGKMEVLFEGVDLSIFYKKDTSKLELFKIKEEFCFLSVGHWLQGDFNEDRKNISGLIKAFLETFKNRGTKPALIIKTSGATYSVGDQEIILDKIEMIRKEIKGDLPNIYLLHGELSDPEMNELYNHPKIKSFITLTKGEGYGRPLLEFSITGKPIIASGWSGHLDFLSKEYNILVGGQLKNVHPSAVVNDMILPESMWFDFDPMDASAAMDAIFTNYKFYLDRSKKQATVSKNEFSLAKMQEKLGLILDENLPKVSQPVELKLPKLADLK